MVLCSADHAPFLRPGLKIPRTTGQPRSIDRYRNHGGTGVRRGQGFRPAPVGDHHFSAPAAQGESRGMDAAPRARLVDRGSGSHGTERSIPVSPRSPTVEFGPCQPSNRFHQFSKCRRWFSKPRLARIGGVVDRTAMHFGQQGAIAVLRDARTQGWEYIAEQQSDQLLPRLCGPVLRDLRD
jgi:hypothetical protein